MFVTGAHKSRKFGRFWDLRAWSRIIAAGVDFMATRVYVRA
jgi:hypothetical protein